MSQLSGASPDDRRLFEKQQDEIFHVHRSIYAKIYTGASGEGRTGPSHTLAYTPQKLESEIWTVGPCWLISAGLRREAKLQWLVALVNFVDLRTGDLECPQHLCRNVGYTRCTQRGTATLLFQKSG